ncbi:hypothetical protein GVAV_002044 [Gurleya vavrai]
MSNEKELIKYYKKSINSVILFIDDNKSISFYEIYDISQKISTTKKSSSFLKKIFKHLQKQKLFDPTEDDFLEKVVQLHANYEKQNILLFKVLYPLIYKTNQKKNCNDKKEKFCIFGRFIYLHYKRHLNIYMETVLLNFFKLFEKDRIINEEVMQNIIKILCKYDEFNNFWIFAYPKMKNFYLLKAENIMQNSNFVIQVNEMNNFLTQERNLRFFEHIFYDLEKEILIFFILNLKIDVNVLFTTEETFAHLFHFYFTSNKKKDFLKLIEEKFISIYDLTDDVLKLYYDLKDLSEWIETQTNNDETIFIFLKNKFIDIINLKSDEIIKKFNLNYHNQIIAKYINNFKESNNNLILKINDLQMANLFQIVSDKILFENEYNKFLAIRLLTNSADIVKEKKTISIFNSLKLQTNTYKTSSMLNDYEHKVKIGLNDVLVLNAHRWPEFETFEINLDEDLNELKKHIENEIISKKCNSKLNWLNHLSTVEIEINGTILQVSLIQYQILKFVEQGNNTVEFLNDYYKNFDYKKDLEKLIDCKFLEEKNKKLQFCDNILNIKAEELIVFDLKFKLKETLQKDENKINIYDNSKIDVLIIQKLKKNKSFIKNHLIKEINLAFPNYCKKIDSRIEYLKENEFIQEIDEKLYYLP